VEPLHHSPRGPQARGQRRRAAVLSVAAALASEEGLEPLSIGRIADELGISKAGVFSLFGSKEALQLATIEAAREIYVDEVYRPALARARGLPRLWGLCESVLSYLERRVFPGGCFFVAIQTEFDARPGPVRERLVEIESMWSETWLRLAEEAQEAGGLNPDADPVQLAFELRALAFAAGGLVRMPGTEERLARTRAALRQRLVDAGAKPEWFMPTS
jgi:AcrR family transcriptional regulator